MRRQLCELVLALLMLVVASTALEAGVQKASLINVDQDTSDDILSQLQVRTISLCFVHNELLVFSQHLTHLHCFARLHLPQQEKAGDIAKIESEQAEHEEQICMSNFQLFSWPYRLDL